MDHRLGDGKMHPWNGRFLPSSLMTSAADSWPIARRQRFAKGDAVFHAGDPAESLHLVATGRLAVWSFSELGDATMLRLIGPGGFVGELSLLEEGQRRSATVRALDEVETLSVGRNDFDRLRLEQPSVDRILLAALASELRRVSDLLMEMLFVPAETRVLRRLLSVATLWQERVPLPITQRGARWVGRHDTSDGQSRVYAKRPHTGWWPSGVVQSSFSTPKGSRGVLMSGALESSRQLSCALPIASPDPFEIDAKFAMEASVRGVGFGTRVFEEEVGGQSLPIGGHPLQFAEGTVRPITPGRDLHRTVRHRPRSDGRPASRPTAGGGCRSRHRCHTE